MANSVIKKPYAIHEYSGSGTINVYGNLDIPTDVVTPTNGVVIGVATTGNYKAVILGDQNKWMLRFFNYATTNMNSVTSTNVSYTIFYVLK